MAGTLRIAYIGIRNSKAAMIGPPRVSIMPRMLGFQVATSQHTTSMNAAVTRSRVLAAGRRPLLTIRPLRPSLAPM
ncbi:hypothetical protein D9M71_786890 [compost metagenome]